jgi:hypothetical protein
MDSTGRLEKSENAAIKHCKVTKLDEREGELSSGAHLRVIALSLNSDVLRCKIHHFSDNFSLLPVPPLPPMLLLLQQLFPLSDTVTLCAAAAATAVPPE